MKKITSAVWILFMSIATIAQNPTFNWVKSMGGTWADGGRSIILDGLGNIYLTGSFAGTADFDPGAGVFNLTSNGANDVFISKLDASGNFVWAKAMGGANNDEGNSIAIDASGNVYTIGRFDGTFDSDPGIGTFNLNSVGMLDIFISKLDKFGNFVWAKSMGGTLGDNGTSIAIDVFGNIYTTGDYYGSADFDPGASTFNLTSSSGGSEAFISKLDPSGNFVWAKSMGGTQGKSITLDLSSNVFITGAFMGTHDFDPGSGTYNLTAIGFYDIFISKLDPSGNFIWAKSMKGTSPSTDYALSIAVDASGNVFTTGFIYGTTDFDPGVGTFNLSPIGNEDIFISKLDPSGNFVWAKSIGSTINDEGISIQVDATGNVYTTGFFYGTVDFDPGVGIYNLTSNGFEDIFISKLDPSGNFVWAVSMGSANSEVGNSIAIDASGNIYTTGAFYGTVDFDPSIGIYNLSPVPGGYCDIFVHKMSVMPMGVEDNTIDNFVSIYPNPTSTSLHFGSEQNFQNSKLEIINSLGQTVLKTEYNNQIDVSELISGFYTLLLKDNSGSIITKKFVKE